MWKKCVSVKEHMLKGTYQWNILEAENIVHMYLSVPVLRTNHVLNFRTYNTSVVETISKEKKLSLYLQHWDLIQTS